MNGSEIISFLSNNLSDAKNMVHAIVGSLITAIFLRSNTATKKFLILEETIPSTSGVLFDNKNLAVFIKSASDIDSKIEIKQFPLHLQDMRYLVWFKTLFLMRVFIY